jgi:ATP-binding cassette subfamily C (CFTR/MRP) protein 1
VIISCASLVLSAVQAQNPIVSAPVISALVGAVAPLLVGLLTHLNHTRTRRSSTILLTLWPLYLIERVIGLRTQVLIGHAHLASFALDCALLAVGLVSWTLECFCPDRVKVDSDAEPEEKELPYERANIYSRLTYVQPRFI